MEFVGRAVIEHRRYGGIAENDLHRVACGRVVVGDGFDVGRQEFTDGGKPSDEGFRDITGTDGREAVGDV